MRKRILQILAVAVVVPTLANTARADHWPNWRGPAHNGTTTKSGLPSTISKTEDIKWEKDDNPSRSPVTVAEGNLFIRMGAKLYCIGE